MNRFLLFIAFSLILSCSDDEGPEMTIPENCIDDICIDGEWKWVESYGSIAGITITPETEMISKTLIIDDTNYSEFVDGELVLETEYEYVKSDELSAFTNDSLILKLGTGNWYAVFEENENLILFEACIDCWEHTYTRE